MGIFGGRKKFRLVVVCTANRTRSAFFAGLLTHLLRQHRPEALRQIEICSAGTQASPGGRANDVAALIARNHGFSLRGHVAQRLTRRIVEKADLILVMEQAHKQFILDRWPEAAARVFRLMEFGWQSEPGDKESLDVPDPTGCGAEEFKAFEQVACAEAERIVDELLRQGVIQ